MGDVINEVVTNYGAWIGAVAGLLLALDRLGALLEGIAAKTANPYDDKAAAVLRGGAKLANWLALKFSK